MDCLVFGRHPFTLWTLCFLRTSWLILEVNDSENNYHFNLIQNKNYKVELNSNNFIEKLFGDRKINITEKDWQKIQLNYYNNPIPEYKEGKAVMFTDKGDEYTQNDYRNLKKLFKIK
ncbi:hypothetical protein [Chryseobacterium indoltheticum]|uniref:hypothetical protein n=1 Tax=Chryseobacterium indoltheticum TaxID=254 RepID=UPI003F49445C